MNSALTTMYSALRTLITFLKEEKEEIRRITWPNRKVMTKLTAVVLGVTLFVALYSAFWDFLLQKLIQLGFSR